LEVVGYRTPRVAFAVAVEKLCQKYVRGNPNGPGHQDPKGPHYQPWSPALSHLGFLGLARVAVRQVIEAQLGQAAGAATVSVAVAAVACPF